MPLFPDSQPQIGGPVAPVHILYGDIADDLIILFKGNQQQHPAVISRLAADIGTDLLFVDVLLRSRKPACLLPEEHVVIYFGILPVQRAQIHPFSCQQP
ncbi:hypothetical protein D3C80_1784840 [compost metagenome]